MFDKKEYKKTYRIKNKNKIKEYNRIRYIENKDIIRARAKQYYENEDNKEKIRKQKKQYYEDNKEKLKVYDKIWRITNKDVIKERGKLYYKNNKEKCNQYYKDNFCKIRGRDKQYRKDNIEKIREYQKTWRRKNNERLNKNQCDRVKTDLKFNLNRRISTAIRISLRNNKNGKHWENLVGYNMNDLIERLERTMPEKYTWRDYLQGKLQIDHIIPKSVFHFTKPEHIDFKRCWSLNNLRLLPARDNLVKSSHLTRPFQPSLLINIEGS